MKQTFISEIEKDIENHPERAVQKMADFLKGKDDKLRDEVLVQSSAWKHLEKQRGMMSVQDAIIQQRIITDALFKLKSMIALLDDAFFVPDVKHHTLLPLPSFSSLQMDDSHCLRKTFTQRIVKLLCEGSIALNVTNQKSGGKTRFLDDLKKCKIPHLRVVVTHMKSLRTSYREFLNSIALQLDLRGDFTDLNHLIDTAQEKIADHLLICIDDFDALNHYSGIDPRFDETFISQLNNIKNRRGANLILTSQQQMKWVKLHGVDHNSILHANHEAMKPIRYEEITAELERKLSGWWILQPQHHAKKEQLIREVENHERRFFILKQLISQIEGEDNQPFEGFDKPTWTNIQ